jgi:hypothetical protein
MMIVAALPKADEDEDPCLHFIGARRPVSGVCDRLPNWPTGGRKYSFD